MYIRAFFSLLLLLLVFTLATGRVLPNETARQANNNNKKRTKRKANCNRCFKKGDKRALCRSIATDCESVELDVSTRQSGKKKQKVPRGLREDTRSMFCRAFVQRFMVRRAEKSEQCSLDIGSDRLVVTDGFSLDFADELRRRKSDAGVAVAKYEVIENYDAASYGEGRRVKGGANFVSRYGRTNTAAKVWITSSQYIRWQIINAALNKLTQQATWADAFTNDRSTFTVQHVNGNTYIVYIPFSTSFEEIYRR